MIAQYPGVKTIIVNDNIFPHLNIKLAKDLFQYFLCFHDIEICYITYPRTDNLTAPQLCVRNAAKFTGSPAVCNEIP